MHTTLIMMIMMMKRGDKAEAQYKYQPSCRVMVGVELSGGPAKPPRWAFRLGRHRGCTGKTRTFDLTAAVVQTELTSSRETARAH